MQYARVDTLDSRCGGSTSVAAGSWSKRRLLWGCVIAAGALGVVIAACGADQPALLLVLFAGLLTVPLVVESLRYRSIDWFSPVNGFVALFGIFWLLRSLYIYLNDYSLLAVLGSIDEEVFVHGLSAALLGLCTFYIGCYLLRPRGGRGLVGRVVARFMRSRRQWNWQRVKLLLLALSILACVAAVALVVSHGGLVAFVENWSETRFEVASGFSILKYLAYSLQPITWCLYVYQRREGRRPLLSERILFYSWVGIVCLVFLVMGDRAPVLLLLIGLVIIWSRTAETPRQAVVIAVCLALIFLGLAFREWRASVKGGRGTAGSLLAALNRDFTSVDLSYYYFEVVPERIGFLNGLSLTDIPAFAVPRFVWEGKPTILGPGRALQILFSESNWWINRHISPSLVGDLYLNFSYSGVVVGMLVVGWVLGSIESYLDAEKDVMTWSLISGTAFAAAFWLMKSGLFGGIIRTAVAFMLPLFVVAIVCRQLPGSSEVGA